MAIKRTLLGNFHRDVALGLFNLANLEKDVDNFEGAIGHLQECINVLEVRITLYTLVYIGIVYTDRRVIFVHYNVFLVPQRNALVFSHNVTCN